MMRWMIGSSLRFRALVVAIASGLMFFGILQLNNSPVDVFPEFAPPSVEIQTPALGLSATEVESLVTVPMEEALQGVPDLDDMRSKSVQQLSSIMLIFKPGTDLLTARQQIQERFASVTTTLPSWAGPPLMLAPLSSTRRVMKIGLTSESINQMQLSMISYWTIRARLLQVPGVANIPIWGEQLQMMQVQVDPKRMAKHDVALDDVMETTADALDVGLLQFAEGSLIGTGGIIDTPNQRMDVHPVLPIRTPADLAKVTVTNRNGQALRLDQVADVVEGHQPLAGDAVINGGPGLMLIIEKLPWANTLEVTRGVEEALRDLQPGLTGIQVETNIFKPANFIETAIDNLTRALLLGCVLVILVLIAFLFEWRTALISVVAIPLSLLSALLILHALGSSINTMILAGLVIAVGVVVDDAIIDVENIVRRLREARRSGSTRSTAAIILDASMEVRGPIVYATLIIVAATAPVFFLEGLTSAFFRPLALAYTLAVLASLLVALTVTPALALLMLHRSQIERRDSPLVRVLHRGYGGLLGRAVKRPTAAFATLAIVAVAGIATVPAFGQDLFPTFKERSFLMHFVSDPSTSQIEEARIVQRASAEIQEIPGVEAFGAHIGTALLGEEVSGVNFGEMWITISEKVDYDTTIEAIQEVVDGYPGLFRDVQTYLKERTEEVLTGESDAIIVRVTGDNLETLREHAESIEQIMADTAGVIDQHTELLVDIPQVEVEVDLAAAHRYGLKPGDVRRAAATIMAGEEVGDIFRDGKAYDIQVWSTPETRQNVSDIEQLPIDTPSGKRVQLRDVANVAVKPTPNAVFHDAGTRYIDVGANVEGRDLGSVAQEIEQQLDDIALPRGYGAKLIGQYQERQQAQRRLLTFSLGAALLILLLLVVSYGSWRLAMLSFVALPAALVGGILAAFATGGIISLGSLVGFLTVLGIAARNGILLISHYQHLEQHEGEKFGPQLVLRGSKDRLRPILMTTLATGLALVPLVALGELPGQEIEHPMAIVILGGLVTSTLLNLFVVPVLYLWWGKSRSERERLAADEPADPPARGEPAPVAP